MRVLFYPVGGLANRMRAIDSAVNFCESQKCGLNIYWIKDSGLNCDFKAIWEPVPFIIDVKGRMPGLFFYLYRRFPTFKYLLKIAEKLRILKIFVDQYVGKNEEIYNFIRSGDRKPHYLFLVIKTCEDFYPSGNFRRYLFRLLPEIEERVTKETARFDNNTIGVHIRRKDNILSIENSTLELYEKKISEEWIKCPGASFYITSDDSASKDFFRADLRFKNIVQSSNGILNRNSEEGIIQSVIELFALSRTKKIIGSHWSSYSEMAAIIGEIELEVVRRSTSELLNEFP